MIYCGSRFSSTTGCIACGEEKCAEWYKPTGECSKVALVKVLHNLFKLLGERE